MAALSSQLYPTAKYSHCHYTSKTTKSLASCSMQPSKGNNIKVVINGAAKEIGIAAVRAVTQARGMEVAGAVDKHLIGEDIGKVCDMEEPLEIPIMSDLTMVLGSISQDLPSQEALQIANNLSNLGQIYNREDASTDVKARGQVLGEDGVRVHSMVLPGLPSGTAVYFSGPGEVYCIKHDISDVQSLMPGLILAIRRVVRLKNLVYGLEKFL